MKKIEDVDQRQLKAYRQMTGEERLRIGLGLYEASLAIAREGIRNRFPGADDAFIEEKLRARIRAGYEIEAASEGNARVQKPIGSHDPGWSNQE